MHPESMNPADVDGEPLSNTQYNDTSEEGGYCTTQSVATALDFFGGHYPYNLSPISEATEASGPVLTPVSDSPAFPPGTDYTPSLCQPQQREPQPGSPLSAHLFPTPPSSASYNLEAVDGPPLEDLQAFHNNIRQNTMGNQPNPSFPRQMPNLPFGGSSFAIHHDDTALNSLSVDNGQGPHSTNQPVPPQNVGVQPAPVESVGGRGRERKTDVPYAQLLWRAFMGSPSRSMMLQQVYQWFRENTNKADPENKGWQNSIRHNLSMNAAFVKRDRTPNTIDMGSNKKSTEWVLADWAVKDGVQSTTRYRKGNTTRRGGSRNHHRLHGNNLTRAASVRKSNINASKNRSTGARKSTLGQTVTQELLAKHIEPFNSLYNRTPNHVYTHNVANGHPMSYAMDWMNHPLYSDTALAAQGYEPGEYTYNNLPSHQMIGVPSQQGIGQTIYPAAGATGSSGNYEVPRLSADNQVYDQRLAPPESYNEILSRQGQINKSNYFAWDAAPGGNAYN